MGEMNNIRCFCMRKIVVVVGMFLLLTVSCQTLFNKPQVEYSPLLSSSFSARSQPARIVSGSQSVSSASYKQIGVVSVCEKAEMPFEIDKKKIGKMVQALREQASEQGGDIVRQKEELKKDDILRSTYVKLDDTKVTGESGSVDILSVVYKTGDDLMIIDTNPKTGELEADEEVTQTSGLECVKAEVWRAKK